MRPIFLITRCGACTVLLAALFLIGPVSAPAIAAGCQFQLGFNVLHDALPGTVGACLEDEGHNPANGDALQHTAGGLLVWRKADNWTAFTDGDRSWVNGPNGLQQRLNTQRFAWEANPDGMPVVGATGTPFPPITVRQPQPGDLVDLPVLVVGLGTGFEGRFAARLRDASGKEIARQTVHAGGMGIFGNFQVSLLPAAPPVTAQGSVEVFVPAPKGDGTELNKFIIPVTFGPVLLPGYHGFALHTVAPGETLRSIAQHWYGDSGAWTRLLEANRMVISNPDMLTPGQRLRVPQ